MDCHLPVCLEFLLRSKTYLKELPPRASIANQNFSLFEHMSRLVYTLGGANYAATQLFTLVHGA